MDRQTVPLSSGVLEVGWERLIEKLEPVRAPDGKVSFTNLELAGHSVYGAPGPSHLTWPVSWPPRTCHKEHLLLGNAIGWIGHRACISGGWGP